MSKRNTDLKYYIIISVLLIASFLFIFFNNLTNQSLVDTIVRLLYSGIIFTIILSLKFDILKCHRHHLFLLAIPALLISINNFPFIAFFNHQTTLTASQQDIYYFLLQCLTVGLFEELVFRGLVLSWLLSYLKHKKYYIWKSIIISSLLFGLMHVFNVFSGAGLSATLLQVVYTTLTGMMWAAVLILTKNIWIVVSLHTLYNMSGLFFPTLGQVTGQWDIWTVTITIIISLGALLFYMYHIVKMKDYHILPYEIKKGT